jgi:hypothetical protein
MEYMVAWDADLKTFIGIVNSNLELGWELRGGIAVSLQTNEGDANPIPFFYQAMARRVPQDFVSA